MTQSAGNQANLNSKRQWLDTEDSHQLVDALYNWDAVVYHLRPWSYESKAVLRAFHDVRLVVMTN